MTNTSNKSSKFIDFFSSKKFQKIGKPILITLLLVATVASVHFIDAQFFYKTSGNTFSVTTPTEDQTVGGGYVFMKFNKDILHRVNHISDLDIWVNDFHVHGYEFNGLNNIENNPIKSVVNEGGIRITLKTELMNDGDIIKVSSKRFNKNATKFDIYLDANRSWVYKKDSMPEIKNIIKKPLNNPLRPEYIINFYRKVDGSIDKDDYIVYTGEGRKFDSYTTCHGPEKKIKSEIELSDDGKSAVVSVLQNIKRRSEPTCIYLMPRHLIGYYRYENGHIDVFVYKDPEADIEIVDVFNPENNFYSNLKIDFKTPVLIDNSDEIELEEFIEQRKKFKEELANKVIIKPNAEIDLENIYFSPTQAIIPINLQAETNYSIKLQSVKDIYGNSSGKKSLEINTGKQEYLGLKINNSQSVYKDTDLPKFTFVQYKKPIAEIKLCRIGVKEYGVIEHMYNARKDLENSNYFFEKGIDLIDKEECFTKELEVSEEEYLTEFGIDDLIGSPGRSGLYFMTFANDYERKIDDSHSVQYPIFFSVVDSHITMKVSKNGKLFVWVNDLETGEGVPNLSMNAYKSDFVAYTQAYNREDNSYDTEYMDPIDGVLNEPIALGKTDANGFLETEIPSELNAYNSSVNRWWDDSMSDSLILTAYSNNNLTFVSNKWNDGIAHWNFGYNPVSGWHGGSDSNIGQRFMSHVFSERKLYLPGEKVYLKAIARELDKTLVIPNKSADFVIKVFDSGHSEILNKTYNVNDFGSILEELDIKKNAKLGTYTVRLFHSEDNTEVLVAYTSFSVEEFKKPKFKVDIQLDSNDLKDSVILDPDVAESTNHWGHKYKEFSKKLTVKANILASYYSGGILKNAKYEYKVYKQYYYGDRYWDNCYWGCYWEPHKDFYSSGHGKLSLSGYSTFDIEIDHNSRWSDYKYIVEVTIIDENGETITGTGSIVVKLPENKSIDPEVELKFTDSSQFVEKGSGININLSPNKEWNEVYNNQYELKIIKNIYTTTHKMNTEGRLVPQVDYEEEEVLNMEINNSNFELSDKNILSYKFTPESTGEYVYEIYKKEDKDVSSIVSSFEIYAYDNDEINNAPILDDNKIKVLSEKTSYKIGETARFLIKLPFDNARMLVTTEKTHVIDKEVVDISNNIYLYEVYVDETFVPNAYLSFIAFAKGGIDYKVGYSEIVVDKSEKVLEITSSFDKSEYEPREDVVIKFKAEDINGNPERAELAVAVVDESLIALLGNIDMDILKKFYQKMAFQTDTSLTSVAMMNHIFFSRKGYVGGSGEKGGDSSVFTRSIFKNTAYYNGSVITDSNGNGSVKFQLPDNIGDFRVIVLGSTKKSNFGAHENTFSVRKNLVIEEVFPMIFRQKDKMKLGANIFNYTDKEITVDAKLESTALEINEGTQKITIPAQENVFVTWDSSVKNIPASEVIYFITAIAENGESDRIQKTVEIASTPLIADYYSYKDRFTNGIEFELSHDKEVNRQLSYVQFSASTSLLSGIDKIANSLLVYPYGCLEQLTSTTLPNALLLKLSNLFTIDVDYSKIDENLNHGLESILAMQNSDGGFGYWPGDPSTNHHYSPYAIWGLATMKDLGVDIDDDVLKKAENYLITRLKESSSNITSDNLSELASGFSTLAKLKSSYFSQARQILYAHKSEFDTHEQVFYALALSEYNSSRYHNEIMDIVENIDLEEDKSRYYYWNKDTYKAVYAQILLNTDKNNKKIDVLIEDLYKNNYASYYYSTQTKIQSFIAFIKYIETIDINSDKPISIRYKINGKSGSFTLRGKNILKKEKFYLSEFPSSTGKVYDFSFSVNGDGNDVKSYVDADIVAYPEDLKDVTPSSNGVWISKEIKGIEMNNEKEGWYRSNIKEINIPQDRLKIGETYMIKFKMKFDNSVREVAIEDHLPSGIQVLNPRFKTTSSEIDQGWSINYPFGHTEYRKNVVFGSADRMMGDKEYEFKYFITPTIEGEFTMPPVSIFPMYQPAIEAHTGYSEIKIVK